MQCTLLIPHLWWSHDAGDSGNAGRVPAVPGLEALLARALRRDFPAVGWEEWLCQAFEVERQHDWPVAPLTLTLDGGEPGEAYWLRADPVHLRPRHDGLLVADGNSFAVSQAEADALAGALNTHFQPEGLQFSAPDPARWYLRLVAEPGISTRPLDEVAGSVIDSCRPQGPNALRWSRYVNEMQMLLHSHPANEAREAQGSLPINGVWLWGGGRWPPVRGRHFCAVAASEPLALALASHADIPAAAPGDSGARWLETAGRARDAHHLLVLSPLTGPARRGDRDAWRDALEALDRDWISPLLSALKGGPLKNLALVAPGSAGCPRFELTRAALFRLWRRCAPLDAHAPAA